jgi:hypothetical protein
MTEKDDYPEFLTLFGGYLGQDYYLWGNTIDEILARYKEDSSQEDIRALLEEVKRFTNEHPSDLEEAFEEAYGFHFSPKLWDCTAATFFEELKKFLDSPKK